MRQYLFIAFAANIIKNVVRIARHHGTNSACCACIGSRCKGRIHRNTVDLMDDGDSSSSSSDDDKSRSSRGHDDDEDSEFSD